MGVDRELDRPSASELAEDQVEYEVRQRRQQAVARDLLERRMREIETEPF